jgi:hypothetical protein
MINYIHKLLLRFINKASQDRYKRLINSSYFRSLYNNYRFKNEEEWFEVSRKIIKDNLNRLVPIMNYDVLNGNLSKYFK